MKITQPYGRTLKKSRTEIQLFKCKSLHYWVSCEFFPVAIFNVIITF